MAATSSRRHRLMLLAAAGCLALTAAGCESLDKMNPFLEKEKPLPGARVPVFPEGVPGVDYNAAPPQPANSTIYDLPPPEAPAAASAAPAQ